MSRIHLHLTETRERNSVGQFGGPCPLADTTDWPQNSQGQPLTHAFTLWAGAVAQACGLELPAPFVSVFTPYNPDDYFLDAICYFGQAEELGDLETVVLFHAGGPERTGGAALPQHWLTPTLEGPITLGAAELLQNEPLGLAEPQPVLQFSGYALPSECHDLFWATENVGYLYLHGEGQAIFFVQNA